MSLPPFLNRYCFEVEVEVGSQPGEEIVAVEHTDEAAFEVLPVPGDDAVGLYAQCNFEEEPVFGVFPLRRKHFVDFPLAYGEYAHECSQALNSFARLGDKGGLSSFGKDINQIRHLG